MANSRSWTPLILGSFFALILFSLVAASTWSRAQVTEAEKAEKAKVTETNYAPEDDRLPVMDAVIEKTAG